MIVRQILHTLVEQVTYVNVENLCKNNASSRRASYKKKTFFHTLVDLKGFSTELLEVLGRM
jgi:hypothetical protein